MMSKALDGLSVMIFGERPLVPMKIEQAIATNWPASEVKLESFEDYSDALSLSRNQKSFGLNMLMDCPKTLPLEGLVKNLSRPYEDASGFPSSVILLAEGTPTMTGYKLMAENPNIIAYSSVTEILDEVHGKQSIKNLWNQFVTSLDKRMMPESLKTFLFSSATCNGISASSIHFKSRVSTVLQAKANLSWMESIALSWVHLVEGQPEPLKKQEGFLAGNLTQILIPKSKAIHTSIDSIAKSSETTGSKILLTVNLLDQWRELGVLQSKLDSELQEVKKFSPFILRSVSSGQSSILQIASDSSDNSVIELQKKVG